MAGIRTAAVINVGTATLAAFIGAGGLGDPIAAGLALSDTRMILSGALPAAVLALVVDALARRVRAVVRPGREVSGHSPSRGRRVRRATACTPLAALAAHGCCLDPAPLPSS